MGFCIIKPKQDEDFYVLWSLTTDSPSTWGTRERLEQLDEKYFPKLNRNARFQRADQYGTSQRDLHPMWSWDEDPIVVYHLQYEIRRSRLKELCEVLGKLPTDGSQDESGEVMVLMEPDLEYRGG